MLSTKSQFPYAEVQQLISGKHITIEQFVNLNPWAIAAICSAPIHH